MFNDLEVLNTMLEQTGKAYVREGKKITLSVKTGKDFVFYFDSDNDLERTAVTTPQGRGVQGFKKHINFKRLEFGPLTFEHLRDNLPGVSYAQHLGSDGKASIVGVEKTKRATCIKLEFQPGDVGVSSEVKWLLPIPEGNEYYYEYNLKFGADFDFVKGGKLPGLGCGLRPNLSPQRNRPLWSTRFQWAVNGGASYKTTGVSVVPLKKDNVRIVFQPMQWYRVQCRIKINTPNVSDGILQVWFDGIQIHNDTAVSFTDDPDFGIEWFYFGTFFGGNKSDFAATKVETIFLRNIRISTSPF